MHKFSGIDFQRDIIDLDWEIIDLCNYKCPYCYNIGSNKRCKIVPKSVLDLEMAMFEESNYKICVDILGGEPSLHPALPYVLERCSGSDVYSNIVITTNNSRYIRTPNDPRIAINASLHAGLADIDQYVANAFRYVDAGVKFTAVIMMEYNATGIIADVLDRLAPLRDGIDIEPIYIYDSRCSISVRESSLDIERMPQFVMDGRELTLHDVYAKKLNRFRGWMCNPMKHSITTDGIIIRGCKIAGTIQSKPHYFRSFEAQPFLCELDECVQDCNLVAPKYSP